MLEAKTEYNKTKQPAVNYLQMKDPEHFFSPTKGNGTATLSNEEKNISNLWNGRKAVFIQLLQGNGL